MGCKNCKISADVEEDNGLSPSPLDQSEPACPPTHPAPAPSSAPPTPSQPITPPTYHTPTIILPLTSTPVVRPSNRARMPRVSPPRRLLPNEVARRRRLYTIVEEFEEFDVDVVSVA